LYDYFKVNKPNGAMANLSCYIRDNINEKSAPAFIWSTYADELVPIANSILAALAYEKVGVPFSLHIWGSGRHGLSIAEKTVYGKTDIGLDKVKVKNKQFVH
jgi:hypothetical protein